MSRSAMNSERSVSRCEPHLVGGSLSRRELHGHDLHDGLRQHEKRLSAAEKQSFFVSHHGSRAEHRPDVAESLEPFTSQEWNAVVVVWLHLVCMLSVARLIVHEILQLAPQESAHEADHAEELGLALQIVQTRAERCAAHEVAAASQQLGGLLRALAGRVLHALRLIEDDAAPVHLNKRGGVRQAGRTLIGLQTEQNEIGEV